MVWVMAWLAVAVVAVPVLEAATNHPTAWVSKADLSFDSSATQKVWARNLKVSGYNWKIEGPLTSNSTTAYRGWISLQIVDNNSTVHGSSTRQQTPDGLGLWELSFSDIDLQCNGPVALRIQVWSAQTGGSLHATYGYQIDPDDGDADWVVEASAWHTIHRSSEDAVMAYAVLAMMSPEVDSDDVFHSSDLKFNYATNYFNQSAEAGLHENQSLTTEASLVMVFDPDYGTGKTFPVRTLFIREMPKLRIADSDGHGGKVGHGTCNLLWVQGEQVDKTGGDIEAPVGEVVTRHIPECYEGDWDDIAFIELEDEVDGWGLREFFKSPPENEEKYELVNKWWRIDELFIASPHNGTHPEEGRVVWSWRQRAAIPTPIVYNWDFYCKREGGADNRVAYSTSPYNQSGSWESIVLSPQLSTPFRFIAKSETHKDLFYRWIPPTSTTTPLSWGFLHKNAYIENGYKTVDVGAKMWLDETYLTDSGTPYQVRLHIESDDIGWVLLNQSSTFEEDVWAWLLLTGKVTIDPTDDVFADEKATIRMELIETTPYSQVTTLTTEIDLPPEWFPSNP